MYIYIHVCVCVCVRVCVRVCACVSVMQIVQGSSSSLKGAEVENLNT